MVVNQRRKKAQDTETPGHTCRKKSDTYKQLLLQGLSQIKCPNWRLFLTQPKRPGGRNLSKKWRPNLGKPQVTVPLEIVTVPEEQIPTLIEEVSTTMVTTCASKALLASWPESQPMLRSSRQCRPMQHRRPVGKCVGFMGQAFLQPQMVGFGCISMLDKPGTL